MTFKVVLFIKPVEGYLQLTCGTQTFNHLKWPFYCKSLVFQLNTKYSKPEAKTTNNNNYYNDVTCSRLHNKDFILVTQTSILVIFHCNRM